MKYKAASHMESTKEGFGRGVLLAANRNDKIIGLGNDITKSVGLDYFKTKYPERFYSIGIAEQNTIAIAVGLSLTGLIPVIANYATFLTARSLDQIRISICYNQQKVIIGGAHSGITVGADGATHQAIEDIAMLRSLPGITIISPCDSVQCELITKKAIEEITGPIYIRYGRANRPIFTSKENNIEIGKAEIMRKGENITIISTGHLTWECIQAGEKLAQLGISAEIINIHTIKPIDKEAIVNSAKKTKLVITAEEHQVIGGLGSAVAEVLAEHQPTMMAFIGIEDQFGESGQPEELMEKYKLTANHIVKKCIQLIETKKSKYSIKK